MKKPFFSLMFVVAVAVAAASTGNLAPPPRATSLSTTVRPSLPAEPSPPLAAPTPEQVAAANGFSGLFLPYQGAAGSNTVRYTAALPNGTAFVADDTLTYTFMDEQQGWTLRERLLGAAPFQVAPDPTTATPVNFFIGSDPTAWKRGGSAYAALSLGTVYPGVHLRLHAHRGAVEKVFVVAPGGSPEDIAIHLEGASSLRAAPDGGLEIATSIGTVAQSPPVAYQEIDGKQTPVAVAYALNGDTYGFTVGAYDPDHPLVIDPTLSATYMGGDGTEYLYDVATDSSGNIYVTGKSKQLNTSVMPYPTTPGAYTTTLQADYDVVVSKFDPTLTTLLASTYIGGKQTNGLVGEGGPSEQGNAIAIDARGNVVVAGKCFSFDFPTTPGAYDTTHDTFAFSHNDGFIVTFDANLSTLIASTLIGGDGHDEISAMAISPTGEIYAAGYYDSNIDTFQQPLPAGYQHTPAGWSEGFVARFSSDLSTLTGFTLFGGDSHDSAQDLVLDSAGNVFITGSSRSTNLPTTAGAYKPTPDEASYNIYVAQFSSDLVNLNTSTFLGPIHGDGTPLSLAIGSQESIYVGGRTTYKSFPVTDDAYQTTLKWGNDTFVSRLSNNLSTLEASTFVGSGYDDTLEGIAYDTANGNIFIAGYSNGSDFPTTAGAYYEQLQGNGDAFVARLDANLSNLLAGTLYGGASGSDNAHSLTLDPSGNPVIVGITNSADFPTTEGAYQGSYYDGNLDGFIVKMEPTLGPGGLVVHMRDEQTAIPGQPATFLVRYRNATETSQENVVIVADIPPGLSYLSSTGGGIYHPDGSCGGQVFWKRDNVPSLSGGDLTFTLDIPWGHPEGIGYIYARVAAATSESPLFDVQPYLGYTPLEESTRWLSSSEIAALLAASPVKELYAQAEDHGYHVFNTATTTTRSDGEEITQLFMVGENGALATLNTDGSVAFVEAFKGDTYTLFDQNGGYTWDRAEGTLLPWGDWAGDIVLLNAARGGKALAAFTGFREARCQFNCTINSIPETAAGMLIDIYDTYSYIKDCKICAQSYKSGKPDYDACAKCTASTAENTGKRIARLAKKVPGLGTAVGWTITVKNCVQDCVDNPDKHICTGPKAECCTTLLGWLGGFDSVCTTECNRAVGIYEPIARKTSCAYGDRCVEGTCPPEKPQPCNKPSCKKAQLNVRVARDPNMKSSSTEGKVLPGQQLTYTIDYENVGSGTAEGVYILDVLDQNLDETTLQAENGGEYSADSRTLSWDIGSLPGGEKGQVSFSINVKSGLDDGTAIVNAATVYFPSALEETPTNPVVHHVRSVVATPQTLETSSTPLPITLSGQDAAGGTLSYTIALEPTHGTLSGTPPEVTYTPPDNGFVGQDRFFFTAGNASGSSDTAEVTINVNPEPGESTPPEVVATSPSANAAGIHVGVVRATFSEPVDTASVTTETFFVTGSEGDVAGYVSYDALAWTATFHPQEPLAPATTYQAGVTGIYDMSRNELMPSAMWSFTTAGAADMVVTLPGQATSLRFSTTTTNSQVVGVASIGTAAVQIGTIVVSGTDTADFSIVADTCSNTSLAPQQSCMVMVEFAPQSPGSKAASLAIPSSDEATPVANVLLHGGAAAEGDDFPIYLPLVIR